jgi:hypothetical protein
MTSLQDHVEKDEVMPPDIGELLFYKPLSKLFNSLSSILKNNNLIASGEHFELKQ